jgi:hypothetical protein
LLCQRAFATGRKAINRDNNFRKHEYKNILNKIKIVKKSSFTIPRRTPPWTKKCHRFPMAF